MNPLSTFWSIFSCKVKVGLFINIDAAISISDWLHTVLLSLGGGGFTVPWLWIIFQYEMHSNLSQHDNFFSEVLKKKLNYKILKIIKLYEKFYLGTQIVFPGNAIILGIPAFSINSSENVTKIPILLLQFSILHWAFISLKNLIWLKYDLDFS